MSDRIHPKLLKEKIDNLNQELAILDVREQGLFAENHLLFASNTPLSRLEIEAPRLVPRTSCPIVLCDGRDNRRKLAAQAAALLANFGYTDLHVLEGGVEEWHKAGFELFAGINVPSKAFGEFIEESCHTPHLTPSDLVDLQNSGIKIVILDSRPAQEFHKMSLPGAINVPGAELVYRIREVAPDPDTLVVVNCAGRTRSIIGAQTLINVGIENKILALENGTMGWHLAGFDLEKGQSRPAPKPSKKNLAWAQNVADQLSGLAGINYVDWDTLSLWQSEAEAHTLYVFDVRSPEEYISGHLPGSRNAPGGQLIQATDTYIGTLGARIVLLDDDGVRAKMTASWLMQMGRPNVYVLKQFVGPLASETGEERFKILGDAPPSSKATIDSDSLAAGLKNGKMTVVDLADSRTYKQGHIQGSWFAIRSDIRSCLDKIPHTPELVLTSPRGLLAKLAAAEVNHHVEASVKVLVGGTHDWIEKGFPVVGGFERMAAETNDVYWLPYDHDTKKQKHQMREYLSWETSLLPKIARDASARFKSLALK